MQVYRGMDIGTAKATAVERAEVEHLMIDLVEPEVDFTVAEFQQVARGEIDSRSEPILIVGGSGLHFRAVVDPLEFPPHDSALRAGLDAQPAESLVAELTAADPEAARWVDLDNPRRVSRAVEILRLTGATPSARGESEHAAHVREYRSLFPLDVFGVDPGDEIGGMVDARVAEMRRAGLLEEVASLAGRLGRQAAQAVGYRQLLGVVAGEVSEEEGFAAVASATRALVKRQRTYFGRDPRIQWMDADTVGSALVKALEVG